MTLRVPDPPVASRPAAGRVLIPVLVGLVLGSVLVILTRGGWHVSRGTAPAVQPTPVAAHLPATLPEGLDPSQVQVLSLPPRPVEAGVSHSILVSGLDGSSAVAALEEQLPGARVLRLEVDDARGHAVVRRMEAIDGRLEAGKPMPFALQARPGAYRVRLCAGTVVVAEGEVSLVEGAAPGVTRLEARR